MSTPENPQPPHDIAKKFFGGDADEQAIHDYLNLAEALDIARLAAVMAPKSGNFNADALIDQAIELNAAAERGLIRKRESMVTSFNYSTLLQLLSRLEVPMNLVFCEEDDPKLRDPVAGPPLRFVSTILKRSSDSDSARQKETLQNELKKLRKLHGPLPQLPCDLITTLRYASPSKTIPDELLIAAFTDFLGIYQSTQEYEREEKIRTEHAELAGLKKQLGELPPPQQALLDQCESSVDRMKEHQRYRETFTPDGKRHPELEAKGKSIFEKHWSGNGKNIDEQSLLWITKDFSPFLQTHGSEYVAFHRKHRLEQQALKKARSRAGGKGARTREELRWERFTKELCTYLRSQKRQSGENPRDLLEAFVGTQSKRTPKAIKEFVDFFGAVWVAATREPVDLAVPKKIRPSLTIEAIDGIRRELAAALKARERK